MLSSDESLNRIFSTSWCARFSSHFTRIKRSLTGAASPGSLSCSVAEKFQRWEYFSPVATQSLYPNVIIRIRLSPSVVRAKVSRHGAWRFDLIEKAVLHGASRWAPGACSSCVKPPCPHTIVVRCMTILPFSVLPLYGIFERKAGRKFHAIAAEVS